jgi:DNA-binding GntR family transcriptional regulator
LQNDPLYLKVYALLRDWIIKGRLLPGERIKETTLAADLGVSRTPVRDALRRLERDRLIVPVPGPAYEVYKPTETDLADLYGARAILEGGAANAAAERRPLELIEAMSEVLAQMREAYRKQEVSHVIELDMRFHELLVTASGNPVLVELHNHLSTRLSHVRSLSRNVTDRSAQVLAQHEAMVRGLQSGVGAAVQEATQAHIRSVYLAARAAFAERADGEKRA